MITLLPYQPIVFKNTDEQDEFCDCNKQSFCQIVAPNDPTQFQLYSSNEVINPSFEEELEGWKDEIPLLFEVTVLNPTDDCNGGVTIETTNGVGPYVYKLNGIEPENSTGIFENLCAGCFFVVVVDSEGKTGSLEFCLEENIDCGAYKFTDELLPFSTTQLLNCLTSDFI